LKIAFDTFTRQEQKINDLACLLSVDEAGNMASMVDKAFALLLSETDALVDKVDDQAVKALEARERENAELLKNVKTSDEIIADMAILIDQLKEANKKHEQELASNKQQTQTEMQQMQQNINNLQTQLSHS
jgi:hypothetical protein